MVCQATSAFLLFLAICLPCGTVAELQWLNTVEQIVSFCKGGEASFGWNYNESTIDNRILTVELFHRPVNGTKNDTIASYAHGQFLTNQDIKYATVQGTNAGLTVQNVTQQDEGVYFVLVTMLSDSHSVVESNQSTVLHVTEPPVVVNNPLKVDVKSVDQNNGFTLTCGQFSSLGTPPATVEWTTPNGTLRDTDFDGKYFSLSWPQAVDGNQFSCQMTPFSGGGCPSNPVFSKNYTVIPSDMRLSIIEQRLTALEHRCPGSTTASPSPASAAEDQCTPDQVSALNRHLRDVQAANDDLKSRLERMNNSLSDLAAHFNVL